MNLRRVGILEAIDLESACVSSQGALVILSHEAFPASIFEFEGSVLFLLVDLFLCGDWPKDRDVALAALLDCLASLEHCIDFVPVAWDAELTRPRDVRDPFPDTTRPALWLGTCQLSQRVAFCLGIGEGLNESPGGGAEQLGHLAMDTKA